MPFDPDTDDLPEYRNGYDLSQYVHLCSSHGTFDLIFGTILEFKEYNWDESCLDPHVVQWRLNSLRNIPNTSSAKPMSIHPMAPLPVPSAYLHDL